MCNVALRLPQIHPFATPAAWSRFLEFYSRLGGTYFRRLHGSKRGHISIAIAHDSDEKSNSICPARFCGIYADIVDETNQAITFLKSLLRGEGGFKFDGE